MRHEIHFRQRKQGQCLIDKDILQEHYKLNLNMTLKSHKTPNLLVYKKRTLISSHLTLMGYLGSFLYYIRMYV
ncbi:hypothetical protein VCRA2110O3_180001 [Vibrio crassostreae]|nr:hypothetical protein VCRA2110O3_180001 [Vibrio crassostreae]CAK3249984.1 hypothetical protein VCRA2120O9_170101 [Vibrio crassostreae]